MKTRRLKLVQIGDDARCVIQLDPAHTLRLSEDDASRLADGFKALSHPVRLQIVDLLARFGGEVCVCEIERHFDLTQPTISHHLKVLREAGLIDGEQRGLWVYYRPVPDRIVRLAHLIQEWQG